VKTRSELRIINGVHVRPIINATALGGT